MCTPSAKVKTRATQLSYIKHTSCALSEGVVSFTLESYDINKLFAVPSCYSYQIHRMQGQVTSIGRSAPVPASEPPSRQQRDVWRLAKRRSRLKKKEEKGKLLSVSV